MEIEFENDALRELFEDGKTSKPNKKYRLQPSVVKQYIKTVKILENAPNIESLYMFNSLHYEKKEGDLKGIEAVWINTQYRLLFVSRVEGDEPDIITICSLTEISNHYQ